MWTKFKSIKLPQQLFSKYHRLQGWIKCGSGEHRSQEITSKIEEIVTLEYEEKKKREEEEKEEEKKKRRKEKKKVEIEELTEEEEEHWDDKTQIKQN